MHGRVESHALEVLEEVARIDARIRDRLLKRARKKGMTRQDEVIKLVEAWRGLRRQSTASVTNRRDTDPSIGRNGLRRPCKASEAAAPLRPSELTDFCRFRRRRCAS